MNFAKNCNFTNLKGNFLQCDPFCVVSTYSPDVSYNRPLSSYGQILRCPVLYYGVEPCKNQESMGSKSTVFMVRKVLKSTYDFDQI